MPLLITPLCFKLRSSGIHFPAFSGSIWHGGLGGVLSQSAPIAFQSLYQTPLNARLYALHPAFATQLAAGETFELRVTLFGAGVKHALAVTQAIIELGHEGLRPGGKYTLETASVLTPTGATVFLSRQAGFVDFPLSFEVTKYLTGTSPEPVMQCQVCFTTPLRIKEDNQLLRNAPSCIQLLRRIGGRLDMLAGGDAHLLSKEERDALYAAAAQVKTQAATIKLETLERRSARSGQQMKLEGFVGMVEYAGEMRRVLPWLKLAQLTQVGGKTAFGFGGLAVISPV